jgi:hypothetical protein
MGSDGAGTCYDSLLYYQYRYPNHTGTVIASADVDDPLLKQRVFLTPMRGWENKAEAPESPT